MLKCTEGLKRVIINGVSPEIDCGLFPVKRSIGDKVIVEADIIADGHDKLHAILLYRKDTDSKWNEVSMKFLENDRWHGNFTVTSLGRYQYTIKAGIDRFESWKDKLSRKLKAKQETNIDFLEGALLIEELLQQTANQGTDALSEAIHSLHSKDNSRAIKIKTALSKKVGRLMDKYADRQFDTTYSKILEVVVDSKQACFSSWYEMFPRSCASESGQHGTFNDCYRRLPYIAEMGFDILYLPPIHPIGHTNRKGKNNAIKANVNDPGTPWAVGTEAGGHRAVHPELGTISEFREFIRKAKGFNIKIAIDLAFQCSPDHPYVIKHPEWFRKRPDNSVQYAENPPKKYQDIYPLDFESEKWHELWDELKDIVYFWIKQGIHIFRVDNPHTKPFTFWEWLITQVKKDYPDIIFLAEAFTRPKIMYHLAKIGFSQSYTYFTWRNLKWEIIQYFNELSQTDVEEFFRPNLWPNTPDILSDYLRDGGRPAFITRLVLAATLGSSYGIYGPPFELCENRRKDTTSEEYMDSEKYELKNWDINNSISLKNIITKVNYIRRQNAALQNNLNLEFHEIDNDQLICYSKHTEDYSNTLVMIVNLDYRYKQSGWITIPVEKLGFHSDQNYQVHDLLDDAVYQWKGNKNFIELNPLKMPAHILKIQRTVL
jgi:starch synthase (maltosyl-transferring)